MSNSDLNVGAVRSNFTQQVELYCALRLKNLPVRNLAFRTHITPSPWRYVALAAGLRPAQLEQPRQAAPFSGNTTLLDIVLPVGGIFFCCLKKNI